MKQVDQKHIPKMIMTQCTQSKFIWLKWCY